MKVASLKTQEPLLQNMLSPEPIMEKRLGNSLVPAVDQMSSSFMKSTPNMLPFIGLCFTVLNLGRLSFHPQTRGLGPSVYVGSHRGRVGLTLLNWTELD